MKDPRYSKGFTLVELIMSVAALSLVCALVLKLFLLCFELNQKAEIKQQAVLYAANIMENIKVIDTPKELEASSFHTGGDVLVSRVRVKLDEDLSSPYGKDYSINVEMMSEDKPVFELTGGKYFADKK